MLHFTAVFIHRPANINLASVVGGGGERGGCASSSTWMDSEGQGKGPRWGMSSLSWTINFSSRVKIALFITFLFFSTAEEEGDRGQNTNSSTWMDFELKGEEHGPWLGSKVSS